MSPFINADTHTFQDLTSAHGQFRYPSCRIKSGSADMADDLHLYPDGVEIQQTIQKKSGQCKFSIKNAYDLKAGRFNDKIQSAFPLGQPVEASLGYGQPKCLFKGYVSDVSFSFSSGAPPSATIVCHDIRALMMQGRLNAMLYDSSFETVMGLLMDVYAAALETELEALDSHNDKEDFRQNTSDFHYIYNYAERRGYEFFVLGDCICLRKRKKNTSPVMTLEWGEAILSFDRSFSYCASMLKGTLDSTQSEDEYSASDQVKPPYASKAVLQQDITYHIDASPAKNAPDLEKIIEAYKESVNDKMAGGKVVCVGLPEIVPGRYIGLKKLDAGFLDKSYYIEDVTHSFGSNGYTTSFGISAQR